MDDEHIWSGQARSDEQLRWAEERLLNDFGFDRLTEGAVLSYEKTVNDFRVFGDPRSLGSIEFRVYPPPVRRAGRRRPGPAYARFKIPDNWKNDLARKFNEIVCAEIERLQASSARPRS